MKFLAIVNLIVFTFHAILSSTGFYNVVGTGILVTEMVGTILVSTFWLTALAISLAIVAGKK